MNPNISSFSLHPASLYLFDMDGTLLDSMGEWAHLGSNYLRSRKILPPADLDQTIDNMTMEEAAVYFQSLGVPGDSASIIHGVMEMIREAYHSRIPLKPGMQQLVQTAAAQKDAVLCVLTTSERDCAEAALTRLGLRPYFREIYTGSGLGMSKRSGEIYRRVCSLQHIAPQDTVVFEDAPYAIRAARDAGCFVYAIQEDTYTAQWDTLTAIADASIELPEEC